jgi:hypothetical protein
MEGETDVIVRRRLWLSALWFKEVDRGAAAVQGAAPLLSGLDSPLLETGG